MTGASQEPGYQEVTMEIRKESCALPPRQSLSWHPKQNILELSIAFLRFPGCLLLVKCAKNHSSSRVSSNKRNQLELHFCLLRLLQ